VIENNAVPVGSVVAYRTGSREVRCGVIRIRRTVIVFLVARVAISGNRLVVAVDVAQHAGRGSVCPS